MPVGCMKSGTLPGNKQHSAKEVYDSLRSKGVRADTAVSAVAIAYRESRFNDKAYCINYNGRGTDRGIFQWNSIAWPNISDAEAYDFDANIGHFADYMNSGGSWAPWRGEPSKSMRDQAADLINGGKGNPGADPNNDPTSDNIIGNPDAGALKIPIISDITDFLRWIVSHLGSQAWWLNVGKTISGLFLIGFGLVSLMKLYEKSIPTAISVGK